MQLLSIHINFELELSLQCDIGYFENRYTALLFQISLRFPLPFCLSTFSCEFVRFISILMIFFSLSNYLRNFLFTLRRICYGLLGHNSQIVCHSYSRLWGWHKSKRNFLLLFLFFLNSLFTSQLFTLLFSQHVWYSHIICCLNCFVFQGNRMLYKMCDSF